VKILTVCKRAISCGADFAQPLLAFMTSHFAATAFGMTIRSLRLDPRWRAHETVQGLLLRAARGMNIRAPWFGTARTMLIIAAALAKLSVAHAAGPAPVQPQQAPAPPQEAPPARVLPDAAPAKHAPVATHAPPGMVLYDRPVFQNGVRVLWHGAWRNGAAAGAGTPAKPAAAAASVAPANPQDILILADNTDASATRMAAEFASAMQSGGFPVKAIRGETSAAALGKAVSSDSADLAIVSMDGLIESGKGPADKGAADWRERAPYLALLSREPIVLIARRETTDIRQLAGRKVNVEAMGGATAASAAIVFSHLNIAPTMINEPLPDALDDLARGEIDAIFTVGGDDSKALAEFGKDGRFHVIAIPYAPPLQALYCPMRLTAGDRPSLVGDDEKIDTIGVMTALVAIDAPPNSPRAGRIAPLANTLFEKFDQLLGSSNNFNWKGVNLAASIAEWPRFGATQAWLEQNTGAPNAALEAFRNMAQAAAAASGGPSGDDADRLYESLEQWSGATQ
jgi:uncharacterized protein